MTERAPLDAATERREAVSIPDLAGELQISERTLRRWRTRGLAMHRTHTGIVCFRDAWDRFAATHPELVARARAFRPGTPRERTGLADAALRLVTAGVPRSAAHAAVAAGTGRSPTTVRTAAVCLDRVRGTDAGAQRRPDAARAMRLAFRADAAGIPTTRIALRLGRQPASVRRLIRGFRTRELQRLDLSGPVLPTFERPDAAEVLLGAAAAREGLQDLPPVHRPIVLLAGRGDWADPAQTRGVLDAMAAARAFLRWRASGRLQHAAVAATARELDAVETDLRWSILLGRRLAAILLPAAIGPIEQALGGPLHRQPAEALGFWLQAAIDVAAGIGFSHDPGAESSPERRTRWAMERRLAADGAALRDGARASARHPDTLDLGLRWQGLEPAPPFLEPPAAVEAATAIDGLGRADRALIEARLGLAGGPPATLEQLAADQGATPEAISRRIRRVVSAGRR